jgi:hypothetical protein
MAASNNQIQAFVDARVRPHCELLRSVCNTLADDIAAIGDVYANLTGTPTWVDTNVNNLPHTLTVADVLAWNALINAVYTAIHGNSNYPIAQSACRTPV